jgi:glutathione synthase/RimK-type ligase-like ATP-grasp enzyme
MDEQAAVLLLGSPQDPHIAAVEWALRVNGVRSISAPSFPFGQTSRITVGMSLNRETLRMSDVPVESLRSVWVRRPKVPSPSFGLPSDHRFLADEWGRIQKNLFALGGTLTSALWVNSPEAAIRAENKLLQLHFARQVGLEFPDTLVTNHAEEAREFISRKGTVIFKTFGMHMWNNRSRGTYHSAGVTVLDRQSQIPDDALALCPGIFQPFVNKQYDVRATVIGNRIFAVKLGRSGGGAYVDWRVNTRAEDFQAEEYEFPDDVAQRLQSLMQCLGLIFGCADFVLDDHGKLTFLEINQAGQFLFVENMCPSIKILQAMAAMLCHGSSHYRLDDSEPVSLQEFLAGDAQKLDTEAMERAMPVLSVADIEE